MDVVPRRRWYRFTLRTLFGAIVIAGIPLGWLAWQLQIVRERRAVRAQLTQGTGWLITTEEYQQIPSRPPGDPNAKSLPFWRVWLGDESISQIGFEKSVSQAQRERVKRLFPEAYVSDQ